MRLEGVVACFCGFDVWSNPWPGHPRRCVRCGGLNPEDMPCQHRCGRREGSQVACADCNKPAVDPERLVCPNCEATASFDRTKRTWSCKTCKANGYIDPAGRVLGGHRYLP